MDTGAARHYLISLLAHALLLAAFLINANFRTEERARTYYEIALVDNKFWTPAGNKRHSNLFGVKNPYEISKDKGAEERSGQPNLSDKEEIEKERKDEESRPSHNKKDVLFKNWIDEVGERAVDPWFREVDKYVRIKRRVVGTFVTHVIVIFNSKSGVVKVVVERGSGNLQMDLAVKNAFSGMQVRPAPKQLIDSDGFGRVRYWFEMELNIDLKQKGKIKLFRRD